MICPQCGQNNPEDSRYCKFCGAQLSIRETAKPTSHPPIPPSLPPASVPSHNPAFAAPPSSQKTAKSGKGWLIVLAILILGCLCVAAGGVILLGLRNPPAFLQDVFSEILQETEELPDSAEVPLLTPIPPQNGPDTPIEEPQQPPADSTTNSLLVVTASGIAAVNPQTQEVAQITLDTVDAPWNLSEGVSPDSKLFGYITGFGGASVNPILMVLDRDTQRTLFSLELSGPQVQVGTEASVGDPAFEAVRAMQMDGSIAWSPDGSKLAFIAGREGNSADVYLLNRSDNAVTRLSKEAGQAYGLHWSPDGQLLQYLSAISFGTGAGFTMESLWVYDFQSNQAQLLENLDSNGEDFLAWEDNSRFWINSSGRTCGGAYNLRIVDTISQDQQVIVGEGFTAVAYDPENKFGMLSVAYDYDNCGNSEPLDIGLLVFGEDIGYQTNGEIGRNKFEQTIAYSIGFNPAGSIFTVYGDEGLQYIYYKGQYGYNSLDILSDVKGFVPYPSPTGDFWAWASRNKTGLWVTEDNSNAIELSPIFSGVPLWSRDGQTLYFFENNQLFSASAPQFRTKTFITEINAGEILGLIN